MQVTDVYGQRFYLNLNNVEVAYKTAEGEFVIDLSNGETMYLTENSYKMVVAWMLRQYYTQHESPDSSDMDFYRDRMRELGIEVYDD